MASGATHPDSSAPVSAAGATERGADSARGALGALAAIVVLAAILRFATLDRQSFWSDEAITVLLARMGLGEMLETVTQTESTPPVYYVLAWLWVHVAGSGEVGLRSLSALAGTLTVPVAYLAGTWLAGRRAGVVAAALVAVSPPLVWYSQEARSYALVVLLCAVSFAAFARSLDAPRVAALTVWTAASVLAVGTHYFAAFVVASEAVWLLVAHRGRAVRWAVGAAAAGALAVLPLALEQRGNGLAENIGTAGGALGERVVVAMKQLFLGSAALPSDRLVAAVVAVLLGISIGLLLTRGTRAERRAALVSASIGVAAVALPVALALVGIDYVNSRNVLVGAAVPTAVALAVGLAIATRRRLGAILPAAVVAILLSVTVVASVDASYQRPDWRGLVRALGTPDAARALVVAPDHQGWFARVPLQVYAPEAMAVDEGIASELPQFAAVARRESDHARPARVSVSEIVVVGVGWDLPALPHELTTELALVEDRQAHGYRYRRYRGDRPVSVPTAWLAAPTSALLLEEPEHG